MIVGFGIGILFSALAFTTMALINSLTYDCGFLDWDEKKDRECLSKYGKIQITVAVLVLCLSTFIGVRVHIRMFESDVRQFETAKSTYSEAIKSGDISGLERIEIVNKITEENKTLARLKYDTTKWYYFYLPDNLVDNLEPIKLS